MRYTPSNSYVYQLRKHTLWVKGGSGCKSPTKSFHYAAILQIKHDCRVSQSNIYIHSYCVGVENAQNVKLCLEYFHREVTIFQQVSATSWGASSSSSSASSAAGGNEASCVSSLIWELNNFPCGTAIFSFRLYSHLVGWVEQRERKKNSHPMLKTRCHCQSTVPHTELWADRKNMSFTVWPLKDFYMKNSYFVITFRVNLLTCDKSSRASFYSFALLRYVLYSFDRSVRNWELINALLQLPDTRAELRSSVSMCLLFDGWCFYILSLNRRRSAWWGLAHGYSGAQPGG